MNTIDDNQRDIRTVAAGDGIDLQYEVVGDVRGDGPPIVLLHGALVGRAAFSRQRKTLAEKYRLILPSARAHDGTDATLPEDYGFATSEVRDVLTVMAAEGVERAHVIAHSSGGATAFQLARQFPDHVDRLILIEPSLFNLLPPEGLAPLTSELAAVIHAHESGGDLAALQACMENIGGDVWHALDEDAKALRLTRLAPMAPIILPHINGLHAFKISPADLIALAVPTLLFYGGASFDFEALIAAVWSQHRPNIELVTIADAGHNLHHENSEVVNPLIIDFLDTGV